MTSVASIGVTFGYLAIGTLEELFEMQGVIVLIYALLSYMVEMRYTFVFGSPPLVHDMPAVPASASIRQLLDESRSILSRRPVIAAAALMLAANLALLYWASIQEPVSQSAAPDYAISIPAIIDQLAIDGVVVTRMPGRFVDNPASHRIAAALLALFDDVIVVTSVSTESSFALAAEVLPFDRNRLTDVLHANGEVQFMIFDTPAVKAIVGTTPIVTQGQ